MRVEGLDKLIKGLEERTNPEPIRRIVKKYGERLNAEMVTRADFRGHFENGKFVAPTGTTKRSIRLQITDGGMTAEVGAGTDYAMYLEWGTRFMSAQSFVRPANDAVEPRFKHDIKALVEGK